ncbi:sugar transferase [Pseudonocardia yuanmonensis]|uniref:Sugar transferase n=1 Tax=Pseudonocardia yuanmonensis TaxID=1095914 RepID=A0ABP8VXT1_9PSEU
MSSNLEVGGSSENTPDTTNRHRTGSPTRNATHSVAPVAPARPRWESRYAWAVVTSDLVSVSVVVVIGHMLGLGEYWPHFDSRISPTLGIVSSLITLCSLFVCRAWEPRILGQGSEEFGRAFRALLTSAIVLGLGGLALQMSAVRPWVFGLIPLSGALMLCGRLVLRARLYRRRLRGQHMHSMVVVGSNEAVADLIVRTRRDKRTGWRVTAACTPTGSGPGGAPDILGIPVRGDLDAAAEVVRSGRHRVVSVCGAPGWSPKRLHRLAWDIEGLGAELVVDPGLMEVAGPRLHVAPVDNLPLLRLTEPAFTGASRVVKNGIDWLGAIAILVLVAPLMAAVAIAVAVDGGPIFFRQTRIGRDGKPFRMIKFRSMVVDAEKRRAELEAENDGAGPLFKLKKDPRVTRVGAVIRKYSIDELPQLFNVVAGSMSLVGPRPPLPEEVRRYSRDAERRLLVKPGLTGLWQVSGRSNLSWEESVRLDLRYVENWSLMLDAQILWKTFGALTKGNGAY